MNVLDSNIARQSASLVAESLEAIPDAVGSVDFGSIADTAVDVAEAAASTGGRTAWRVAGAIASHRRGVAYGAAAVAALAGAALLYKQRAAAESESLPTEG